MILTWILLAVAHITGMALMIITRTKEDNVYFKDLPILLVLGFAFFIEYVFDFLKDKILVRKHSFVVWMVFRW